MAHRPRRTCGAGGADAPVSPRRAGGPRLPGRTGRTGGAGHPRRASRSRRPGGPRQAGRTRRAGGSRRTNPSRGAGRTGASPRAGGAGRPYGPGRTGRPGRPCRSGWPGWSSHTRHEAAPPARHPTVPPRSIAGIPVHQNPSPFHRSPFYGRDGVFVLPPFSLPAAQLNPIPWRIARKGCAGGVQLVAAGIDTASASWYTFLS